MKGPKRLYAGQYEWDVFDIYRIVSDFDGSVYWNIGVNKDYWFGEHGCFYAGYGIDTCNTYGECREIVQSIIEDYRYKVKHKGKVNPYGNWVSEEDENGNYIEEKI